MRYDHQLTGTAARPLAGARAWLITDGKAGLDTQVRGVAETLGALGEWKHVHPRGFWKFAAPVGLLDPKERFGEKGGAFAPPWPALAIGAGVASIPYLRAIRRAAGPLTFTIAIQKTDPRNADLVAAPVHDRCRGPNVVETLTAPHGFGGQRLADLRRAAPDMLGGLPKPRVAVFLGGGNKVYRFRPEDRERLAAVLGSLGRLGASFLLTPSRRTEAPLLAAAMAGLADYPRIVWDGAGENPYPAFLAHADLFVVTADSVNMTGEACATGRPVFVFTPSGGSAKFGRFHEALRERGITRPCPDVFRSIPEWGYTPLDSARVIADEIERRWLRRSRMLSGAPHRG